MAVKTINIGLPVEELIDAVKHMPKREREIFIEDFLASTSPEYLKSIKEAREDYKSDRTKTHEQVFGKHK